MKRKSREVNVFSMSALDLFASALGAFILLAVIFMPFFPNTGDHPKISEAIRDRLAQAETRNVALESELEQASAQLAQSNAQLQQSNADLASCQESASSEQARIQELERQLEQQSQALAQGSSAQQRAQELQQQLDQQTQALEACTVELDKTFLLVVISWNKSDDVDLHVTDPDGNEFYFSKKRYPNSEASHEEDNRNGPGNEIWLHPNSKPGQYKVHYNYYRKDSGSVAVRGNVLFRGGKIALPQKTLRVSGEKPLVATIIVDSEGNVTLS